MRTEARQQTNQIILSRISELIPPTWSNPETIASIDAAYRKWIVRLESFTAEHYVGNLSKTALQTRNLFETTHLEEQMKSKLDSDRAFITYFYDALDIGPEFMPKTRDARADSLQLVVKTLKDKFDPKPSD